MNNYTEDYLKFYELESIERSLDLLREMLKANQNVEIRKKVK